MTIALGYLIAAAGIALLLVGLACLAASFLATTRAWRNGLPWLSGGFIWFIPSQQPPAARPHMRAAMRRFLIAMPLLFISGLLFYVSGVAGPAR